MKVELALAAWRYAAYLSVSRMTQTDSFPLSQSNIRRALILCAVYVLLVIAAAFYYVLTSGDRRFPSHYAMLALVTGVCAWGLRARYRWAWVVAALFAGWQIYYGASSIFLLLRAGAINAPTPAKAITGFLAARTVVLVALFIVLVLLSDREKLYKT